MKKKLIALVLTAAAVSLFAFTACGEGTETESETVSSAAESNVISETSASLGYMYKVRTMTVYLIKW